MTVVQPNSISGINSITAQSDSLSIHKSDGTLLRTIVSDAGISTFSQVSVTGVSTFVGNIGVGTIGTASTIFANGNASLSGIVTAGGGLNVTGDSTLSGTVKVGSNTLITPNTDADNFVIDTGDADSGLSILSATTGRIYFGDAASTDQGSIRYVHTDDSMRFETNSTERLRIGAGGTVEMRADQGSAETNILRFTDTDTSAAANQKFGQLQWFSEDASGAGPCVKGEIFVAAQDTTPDGYMVFATHDGSSSTVATERMRISSAGSVGIGTDTPGAILEVFDATSNTILNVKSGDSGASLNLIDDSARSTIEQNGTTLKISSDTGAEDADSDIRLQVDGASKMIIRNSGDVVTGDPGDDNQNHTGSRTVFTVADTTNGALVHIRGQSPAAFFDISSSGIGKVFLDGADFAIQSGTPASEGNERLRVLSGGGLTFNGDTASANALDDYEQGTFTPTINVEGQSNAGIDNVSGTYVKVGKLVYAAFHCDLNGLPGNRTVSTAIQFGGMPFTSLAEGSDGIEEYIGSVRMHPVDNSSSLGDSSEFIFRLFDNSTGGRIEVRRSNGDLANAALYMVDNQQISASVTYRTAS